MVEFDNLDGALKAKKTLHGYYSYYLSTEYILEVLQEDNIGC